MAKDRFAESPYPDVEISELEKHQLLDLVNQFVEGHFQEYEDYIVVDNRRVNERRWKHCKSKADLHVYEGQSSQKSGQSMEMWDPATAPDSAASATKDMPVMLRVGTVVGHLDDLMFGVVNPTLDVMRVKASGTKPFRSLIIKWMTIDAPLQSTSMVKARDFVYIEATGILHFASGDRVGYQLVHSIEFPQTKPRPNFIRASLSYCSFYRQIEGNVLDVFGTSTVAPGGDVMRFISVRVATEALLSATNLVFCGQMKKLSWMMQHQHSMDRQSQRNENCVMCSRSTTSGIKGRLGKSTCKLCYGCVCYSCKIRRRITFIAIDGRLIQRKVSFCSKCISTATLCDAKRAAIDQAAGYRAYKAFSTSSHSDTAETLGFD